MGSAFPFVVPIYPRIYPRILGAFTQKTLATNRCVARVYEWTILVPNSPTNSPEKRGVAPSRAAIRAAVPSGNTANPAESTALLARLAAAWNRLTEADRLAVVEAAEMLAGPPDAMSGPLPHCDRRTTGTSPEATHAP